MRCVILLFIFVVTSCQDKKTPEPETVVYEFPDTLLAWNIKADSMIMRRETLFPDSSITITRIMNGLSEKYPNVRLLFLKQSGDTVYTELPNADYLGEQMGDAGAEEWFADAVINLTTVPGINYVSFKMATHSHAASNVLGRDNYKDWKKQ